MRSVAIQSQHTPRATLTLLPEFIYSKAAWNICMKVCPEHQGIGPSLQTLKVCVVIAGMGRGCS